MSITFYGNGDSEPPFSAPEAPHHAMRGRYNSKNENGPDSKSWFESFSESNVRNGTSRPFKGSLPNLTENHPEPKYATMSRPYGSQQETVLESRYQLRHTFQDGYSEQPEPATREHGDVMIGF